MLRTTLSQPRRCALEGIAMASLARAAACVHDVRGNGFCAIKRAVAGIERESRAKNTCTSSVELTWSRTCERMPVTYAHAHTIRLEYSPLHAHAHMRMRKQFGSSNYRNWQTNHGSRRTTIANYENWHSAFCISTAWKHNYMDMDLAHNTARLVLRA